MTVDNECEFGTLENVKKMHRNDMKFTANSMDAASRGGNFEIIKWLHENRSEGCTKNAIELAIINGHLNIVEWMCSNYKEYCDYPVAISLAVESNQYDIFIWLQLNDIVNLKKESGYIIAEKSGCYCIGEPELIDVSEGAVCMNCGLQMEISLIDADETMYADASLGIISRGGAGPVDSNMSERNNLSTMIHGDGHMQRLNMWLSMSYEDQVIIKMKNMLSRLSIENNIPPCAVKYALKLFKILYNTKDIHGKKEIYRGSIKTGLIAACLFYSCKTYNHHILSSTISKIFKIEQRLFGKCCKIYIENIDNTVNDSDIEYKNLIHRYSIKLNFSSKISKLCENILNACIGMEFLSNTNTNSITGGILCFVNKELRLDIEDNIFEDMCKTKISTLTKISDKIAENKTTVFNVVKNNKNK